MLDAAIGSPAWVARRVMPAVLLLALSVGVAYAAWFLARTTLYPHALDYGEGPLLDQAVRLARGASIYRVPGAEPPWTVSNYPPVYPGVEAALAAVFGPAYWYGRLVSVLSLLGSTVLVGAIVHRLAADRFAAVVAALLLPAMPYVGYWAALARVDHLALVLSLAGLWCVLRWPERSLALVAAVVLMALAGYTRQTYLLVAPLTAFVWLLGHSPRRAFTFAGGLAALVLLAGLVLNATTHGGFWFHIVTSNVNEFRWGGVLYYLVNVPQQIPVLLLAAVAYAAISVRKRLPSARVIGPYLLASTLLILTAGKIGSNVNYLMEFSVGLCLAVGGLLAWLRSRRRLFPTALGLLALQSVYSVLSPPPWYGWALEGMDDTVGRDRISQFVREAGGVVLADQEMGELPLAGRPILLQPFEMTQLARAGLWDQTPVVASIEHQRYAAILVYTIPDYPLEMERWTAEMLAAIDHAYVAGPRIGTESGGSVVYTPRR
jgi:hypothetical protein